jgi:prolyl-tRNA synthetase
MVIRPYGYAIWERIQAGLDKMIKDTGHENAYFPLFIPESFMKKEAEHVEGFAPECAVVTHGGGQKLEEPLYIRPTSETIIWSMASKWIQSHRDLPFLINQWANIVRWEMRPRLFLRTTEFLWQEGHTAHATEQEAIDETMKMLGVYKEFVEGFLGVYVVAGQKTETEKFAGAARTYSIEAMMKDRKALQAGTSHFFGQNFAKAFNVQFQDEKGQLQYVHTSSWGVSSRLVGAMVMVHGDDNGLVVPPRVAPIQVVIVPIWRKDDEKVAVLEATTRLQKEIGERARVKVDAREQYSPGWKFNEYELKGVPVRIEVGPKDVAKNQAVIVRRDTKTKDFVPQAGMAERVAALLDEIQAGLLAASKKATEEHSFVVDSYDEFKKMIEAESGFLYSHWCGAAACEAKIKEDTKATARCIPLDGKKEKGKCLVCGADSEQRVIFAKAY